MIVDCGDCAVRGDACADCVVTVLLGAPGWLVGGEARVGSKLPRIALDQEELGAMDVLAEGGLVPRLRLVTDSAEGSTGGSLSSRDTPDGRRAM